MLVSRVICQTNWSTRVYVVFQSIISHGWQATGSQSPLLILLQCRQGLGGGTPELVSSFFRRKKNLLNLFFRGTLT
jgi:hypothetical protein